MAAIASSPTGVFSRFSKEKSLWMIEEVKNMNKVTMYKYIGVMIRQCQI